MSADDGPIRPQPQGMNPPAQGSKFSGRLLVVVPTARDSLPVIRACESNSATLFADGVDHEICIVPQVALTSQLSAAPFNVLVAPASGQGAALDFVARRYNTVPWMLVLDDDITLTPGAVPQLRAMALDNNLSYCGARIVPKVHSPGADLFERVKGLSKGSVSIVVDGKGQRPVSRQFRPTHVAVGACALVAVHDLISVGGYDSRFGSGSRYRSGQSLDLTYRLLRAGYRVGYCAEAVVEHWHPENLRAVLKRGQNYGYSDGALAIHWALTYGDQEAWAECLYRHQLRALKRICTYLMRLDVRLASYFISKELAFAMGVIARLREDFSTGSRIL